MKWLIFLTAFWSAELRAQSVQYAQSDWMQLSCLRFPGSIIIPGIAGYDRVMWECFSERTVRLHYSSTHVSTIDVLLRSADEHSEPRVIGALLYAPCQPCNPPKTTVYRLGCNKPLSYFTGLYGKDLSDYSQKHGKRSIYRDERSYKTVWDDYIRTAGK